MVPALAVMPPKAVPILLNEARLQPFVERPPQVTHICFPTLLLTARGSPHLTALPMVAMRAVHQLFLLVCLWIHGRIALPVLPAIG